MNTLIKIIITTVIGLVGTLTEVEDSQGNIQGELSCDQSINNYDNNRKGFCSFNERTFKMLKYKFDS